MFSKKHLAPAIAAPAPAPPLSETALRALANPYVGAGAAGALFVLVLLTLIALIGDPKASSPVVRLSLAKIGGEATPDGWHEALARGGGQPSVTEDIFRLSETPISAEGVLGEATITLQDGGAFHAADPLPQAPLAGFHAQGPSGPLPIIAANGKTPAEAYARPFSPNGRPKVALVVGGLGQPIEIGAGLGLHLGAEQVDQRLGHGGRRLAGHPLAGQQGDDVGHRRVGQGFELVQRLLGPGVLVDGAQVRLDPAQRIGADGLDPGLLQRVVDRSAERRGRPAPGVGGGVVVGQAQGHLVGQAPDARGVSRRQVARRMRQHGAVAGELWPLARIDDLQVRLLSQGARGLGQGALEGLDGAFRVLGHGRSFRTPVARGREGMRGDVRRSRHRTAGSD